nr:type II CRISPR RNA-guided endonuclease Cas9 [Anaerolineaceae bacterium]
MTYFIGLDMGTSSVGYAVSNEQYEILNFRQKAMWGVRLFDEAQTAADRRMARTSRRRLARRNLRLKLLQDLFSEAINAVDPGFYQRLKDSFFYPEDKDEEQIFSLFADSDFTDKDYHKKYLTIYHLRHELISNPEPHDPRLVYLAIHHILKSRGHFLFTGSFDMQGNGQYIETFKDFQATLSEVFEITLPTELAEPIKNAINDKSLKKREKTEALKKITNWKDANAVAILELLSNRKVRISKLFGEEYEDQSPKDVTFEGAGFEDEKQAELQALLSDDEFSLLLSAYRLHNQLRLDTLLQGYETYSAAKIGLYEKHGADLRKLKKTFRKYFSSDDYKAFFSQSKNKLNNYVAYTGHLKKNKKKVAVNYRCDTISFLDDLRKKLEPVAKAHPEDNALAEILVEIDNQLFLPKQVSKDNSLIPNQIHVEELKAILNNASTYLPFLNEIGEDNHTIKEMIVKLAEFRIPYYVGPLNPAHKVRAEKKDGSRHAWITKRSDEPVRPWNFHRVVDEEQSANDFIANLTNKCTYLIGEDVLPKESPSYARFILLNQLNMLSHRGERLPVIYKHAIYEGLFMAANAKSRFSKKDIAVFLNSQSGDDFNAADIGGMDQQINNVLKAERQIEAIAPNQLTLQDKEDIVRLITVLPDSNKMLVNRLKDQFHTKLNDEQIKRISQLSFKDWGNLSEKLLSGIRAIGPGGVETNILDAMWDNNLTLMELLSASYGFKEQIDAYNNEIVGEARTLDYQIVDEYPYLSPAVKRMIW